MNSEKPEIKRGPPPEVSLEGSNVRTLIDHSDDIFFTAIQTTRMAMLVTDPRQPDNPVVFANRAFLSMTGYSPEEVLGFNCRFLQGAATDRATVASIREAIEARKEITTEILNYRKDGSSFWNALYISPVYNKNHELVYFFASQLDVSRRRDAEQALAQAQKMEALGQLTGGISHDFNNLLQVMSGHVELVKRRVLKSDGPEKILMGIDGVAMAISKASKLTQQLLAFARKQRLEGRPINLNSAALNIQRLIADTLNEGTSLKMDLAPDLRNCQIDPTQLEVALLNVVSNARDAMAKGGAISISTKNVDVSGGDVAAYGGLAPGSYATIAVTDTGHGIPKEIIKEVMNPFFTTKAEGKGTGLGLSMVYGFAKQSGGSVDLYSEVNVGTTVRLYFPTTYDAARMPAVPDDLDEVRGGTESILVVDDRREVAHVAGTMLEALGYSVHMETDAASALAWIARCDRASMPDLVFSDVLMPGGMNGFMLARELRRLHPRIAILLTTGYAGDGNETDHNEGVEFDVLKKPYGMRDLARRVRLAIEGSTGAKLGTGTDLPEP